MVLSKLQWEVHSTGLGAKVHETFQPLSWIASIVHPFVLLPCAACTNNSDSVLPRRAACHARSHGAAILTARH